MCGRQWLERIDPGKIERVVAVDVNPEYVKQTGSRYSRRLKGLELHCADVQSELLQIEPVNLMYAASLFEYVDVSSTLRTLKRNWESNRILGVSTAQWRQVDLQAQLQTTRLDAEGADRCCFSIEHSSSPHRTPPGSGHSPSRKTQGTVHN